MKLQKWRNNISCSCYFLSALLLSLLKISQVNCRNEWNSNKIDGHCLFVHWFVCVHELICLTVCVCVGLAFDYKNSGVTNPIIRQMCVEGAIHWMDKTNDVCIESLTQWVYSPNDRTLTDIIANNCNGFTEVKREKLRWVKMNEVQKGVHTA